MATSKKSKEKNIKVSYQNKPDNLTSSQWQIALRCQAAQKEHYGISELDSKEYPGYYTVVNPLSKNEYKVVYRGEESTWNFCSCMDFKTSRLGTCKHIEAVKLWIKEHRKKVHRQIPPYTSVYLSYKDERKVCLRIGSEHSAEFKKMAQPYFTDQHEMRPEALFHINDFFREAMRLDNTFRWYPDALDFILEKRDKIHRCKLAEESAFNERLDTVLKTNLFLYQKEGIRFAFKAGKSIIADEMGLGKTIQALGTAELMRQFGMISSALIVCPTSLKYQWKKEIERFTEADAIVVEGNHFKRKELYQANPFYKIVSYNSLSNDIKLMNSLSTDFLIMDEVQRLKNWNTQISKAARHVESQYAVVLSGTPLENKLEELYSVMQFVNQYALGPYYRFIENTVLKSETGKVIGYKNLNAVGEQLRDILIRRRKKDVSLQLPQRMDKVQFVPMTQQQKDIHEEYQNVVAQLVHKWNRQRFLSEKDRKRLLLSLNQMRMVCDSTYILDQKSRYDTKIDETMQILADTFENGDEKVVIFSQWERMARLVAAELDKMGIRYEYLHGGVPSEKRKVLMDNFTDLPESRVFISTDAGSTGLNLQVASILINLDLPWNPAILEQRIARIYRIGQQRNIQIINLVAPQSIEERMLSTLNFKTSLFEGILDNGEDSVLLDDSKLDKIVESIQTVISPIEDKDEDAGKVIDLKEYEQVKENTFSPLQKNESENKTGWADHSDKMSAGRSSHATQEVIEKNPEEIVQQGISFFKNLTDVLKSPTSLQQLVDSLVEVDKETQKTTLRIPVPDKESVKSILETIGKLL